jgi:hypothetical protein
VHAVASQSGSCITPIRPDELTCSTVDDCEASEAVDLPMPLVAVDRAGHVVAVGVGGSHPGEDVGVEEDRRERLDVVRPPPPKDEALGLECHKLDLLDL